MTRPEPTSPAEPRTPAPAPKSAKDSESAKDAAPPRGAMPPGTTASERVSRGALLLLAAVLGVVVGALGSFGHRAEETWLGVGWPTGLLLCFGGLIGLLLGIGELLEAGAPRSWRPTRLSALGCASAGWLLALLWLTYLGPPPTLEQKGDVVLANDWRSMAYLLGGMLLVSVAVYRAWVATLAARLAQRPGAAGDGHSKG